MKLLRVKDSFQSTLGHKNQRHAKTNSDSKHLNYCSYHLLPIIIGYMVFIREQYPGLISQGKIIAVAFNIYLTKK